MSKEKAAFSGSLACRAQGDSTTETPVKSTNKAAQQAYVFHCLQQRPHSTLELRALGICSPAPRVKELRDNGHRIALTWRHETDTAGVVHRIGVYALQAQGKEATQ